MLRPMDIWRCGLAKQPASDILRNGLRAYTTLWLPELPGDVFHADPFGVWRDRRLHVFVETFSYRSYVGHIDVLTYDAALNLLGCETALREPWHLSYPFVFEADGETWLLPEAFQSGALTLYRARQFPHRWEAVCRIPLDGPAIDATPFRHRGRWWLFYTPSRDRAARRSHLHVAFADRLTGPWHLHPGNPVRVDLAGARPGGTPFVEDGVIVLPVQDCRATYGHAVRTLHISVLDETAFVAADQDGVRAAPWMAPYTDGCHTLAAAGPVTLFDVKRMDASLRAKAARLSGIVRRRLQARRPSGPR